MHVSGCEQVCVCVCVHVWVGRLMLIFTRCLCEFEVRPRSYLQKGRCDSWRLAQCDPGTQAVTKAWNHRRPSSLAEGHSLKVAPPSAPSWARSRAV